jgi:hypothetical protein
MSKQDDDRLIAAIDRIFTPRGYGFDTIDVMCAAHHDPELEAAIRAVYPQVYARTPTLHSRYIRPQLKRIARERRWHRKYDGRWVLPTATMLPQSA